MKKKLLAFIIISFGIQAKEYPKPIPGYFSQKGQDKYLNENLFKGKRSGFFIDIGAHDGISFSNTYFFEKNLEWKGICIEPNPDIFNKLIQNRTASCLQLGISSKNEKQKFLKGSGYMIEMYSGILSTIDERHRQRIEKEITQFGGNINIIEIECKTLQNILDRYQIKYIDFISIDVEGGEEEVIKSIDFDSVIIAVIVIENNFNNKEVGHYLIKRGYEHIKKLGRDDIFKLNGLLYEN